MNKVYMCIDLKSFYASVECAERNLDPLDTNLVVADKSRTEKTICLAVSPSLKEYGLKGRARLFEVVSAVRKVNIERRKNNNYRKLVGKSYKNSELKNNKSLELDYIVASPRMKLYMKYSSEIYNIYLKYLSKDDIFVYSIDEVFCDITNYLNMYKMTPKELVSMIIKDVYNKTGITATAGIGTNMYLAKVSMDIVAKHASPNEIGVRISELDEMSYRKKLWDHTPLTDFWRVGKGYAKKLEENNMYTMGDVALMSIQNENLLYKLFGVNAELLIDHAWGYETTTIKDIKEYKPENNSISSGQVLHCPYDYKKARLIVAEMIDSLALELTEKEKMTNSIVLMIGYEIDNTFSYDGDIVTDYYGRRVPKPAHGHKTLDYSTSSSKILTSKCLELYDEIINKNLLVRRINICACNVIDEKAAKKEVNFSQLDLFSDNNKVLEEKKEDKIKQNDEIKLQKIVTSLKNKYGKNIILKAMSLEEGATMKERNMQGVMQALDADITFTEADLTEDIKDFKGTIGKYHASATGAANATPVGEALLVEPGVTSYALEVDVVQYYNKNGKIITDLTQRENTYKLNLDIAEVAPPKGEPTPTIFEASKSYDVTIQVHGLTKITLTAKLGEWKDGGSIVFDPDNDFSNDVK